MSPLKSLGIVLLVIAVLGTFAYPFRTDPIAMISGKRLTGQEFPYPSDWSFTNEHQTIAVETKSDNPHSVTTLCFIHNGELHIPSETGSKKTWAQNVVADPRIRIKIGDKIYLARAERVTDIDLDAVRSSIVRKFPEFANQDPETTPEEVWFFKVSKRS